MSVEAWVAARPARRPTYAGRITHPAKHRKPWYAQPIRLLAHFAEDLREGLSSALGSLSVIGL
jgi:hypothetical protein